MDKKVLVRYDLGTAAPLRDANGRCVRVNIGKESIYLEALANYNNYRIFFWIYETANNYNKA